MLLSLSQMRLSILAGELCKTSVYKHKIHLTEDYKPGLLECFPELIYLQQLILLEKEVQILIFSCTENRMSFRTFHLSLADSSTIYLKSAGFNCLVYIAVS